MFVHQLGHVLIASRNDCRQAFFGGPGCQGTDDIVCLYPVDHQYGKTECLDHLVDGLNLLSQLLRHGLAVSFVLVVHMVAKGFSRGVEYKGNILRIIFREQSSQHVHHAVRRTRRQTFRVGQGGHRVKRTEEIRRCVHKDKGLFFGHAAHTAGECRNMIL